MPKKVLIADDDPDMVLLVSTLLRERGWKVEVARDAMQTLMFAMRVQPDAIVLDINMPGGTGLEALKKLKMSVKTSQIPVVVMTATTDPAMPATVRGLGADDFVRKPLDAEALHSALVRLAGQPA